MGYSQFLWIKLLEAIAHNVAYSAPATWVGLIDRNDLEFSNVDYSRKLIDIPTGTSPKWSTTLVSSTSGRVENDTAVSWGLATVDWGIIKDVVIFDAVTAGNELMRELLPTPKTLLTGELFQLPAQAVKIRLLA